MHHCFSIDRGRPRPAVAADAEACRFHLAGVVGCSQCLPWALQAGRRRSPPAARAPWGAPKARPRFIKGTLKNTEGTVSGRVVSNCYHIDSNGHYHPSSGCAEARSRCLRRRVGDLLERPPRCVSAGVSRCSEASTNVRRALLKCFRCGNYTRGWGLCPGCRSRSRQSFPVGHDLESPQNPSLALSMRVRPAPWKTVKGAL